MEQNNKKKQKTWRYLNNLMTKTGIWTIHIKLNGSGGIKCPTVLSTSLTSIFYIYTCCIVHVCYCFMNMTKLYFSFFWVPHFNLRSLIIFQSCFFSMFLSGRRAVLALLLHVLWTVLLHVLFLIYSLLVTHYQLSHISAFRSHFKEIFCYLLCAASPFHIFTHSHQLMWNMGRYEDHFLQDNVFILITAGLNENLPLSICCLILQKIVLISTMLGFKQPDHLVWQTTWPYYIIYGIGLE